MFIICVLVYWCVTCAVAQFEGEPCVLNSSGKTGRCIVIENCPYAKDLLRNNIRPQNCGFRDRMPIVCCLENQKPPGKRSLEKCQQEYYPVPEDNFGTLVVGGEESLAKEFPHMAAVGYGNENDKQWLCGGTLISKNFVLTAAHCAYSQEHGNVKWVRLGDLDIKNTTDDAQPQDFSVVQTFPHPDYQPPLHYHDIALLRLDRPANFTPYVLPACLHLNHSIQEILLTATGWGKTEFEGETSSHLMKVGLNLVGNEACRQAYANVSPRRLANGVVDETQVCAGGAEKDTCSGDSGGPLQVKETIPNTWKAVSVVGITSFGKACGIGNSVGVYTRVSYYVPWIENIVWSK